MDLWKWRSTRRGSKSATLRLYANLGAVALFGFMAWHVILGSGGTSAGKTLAPGAANFRGNDLAHDVQMVDVEAGRSFPKEAVQGEETESEADDGAALDSNEVQSNFFRSEGQGGSRGGDSAPPVEPSPSGTPPPSSSGTPRPSEAGTPTPSQSGVVQPVVAVIWSAGPSGMPEVPDAEHVKPAAAPQPGSSGGDTERPLQQPHLAAGMRVAHTGRFAGVAPAPPVPVVASSETAYVTMASGNEAGRMAVTLVRSLLDTGTDTGVHDIVVLLPRGGVHSPECHDSAFRARMGLPGKCKDAAESVPEEIISPQLVGALRSMGAKMALIDHIPRTAMTEGIPGGRSSFWGMALNKLVVFNMTQYRKIVWMDSDTFALKNLDHLFGPEYPTFSGAITEACCLNNGPGIPSGGLWVLEPSLELGVALWNLMVIGAPKWNSTGAPLLGADGKQEREFWRLGDMHIVRHLFSDWPRDYTKYRLWPWMIDDRHGYPAGLRQLPIYAAMTDAQFTQATTDPKIGRPWPEGFQADLVKPEDRGRPVWHALPIVYDQCISQCICLPWRWPAPGVFYSVHFSCLQDGINKPGHYNSEAELMTRLDEEHDCNKYWYTTWYETYKRAVGGRLEAPHWTGRDVAATINWTVIRDRPRTTFEIKKKKRRR